MKEINLHSADFYRDPFPTFEHLRHTTPVYYDAAEDRWVVTRYADVSEVLRNHEVFTANPPYFRFSEVIGVTMQNMDGKDHDSRRSIVAPGMIGKNLEHLILPHVQKSSTYLVDRLAGLSDFPVRKMLAKPLPLKTMTKILGLDEKDEDLLADVTTKILRSLQGDEPFKTIGREAHEEFAKTVYSLIAQKRITPGTDLISGLISSADESGYKLTDEEVCSFVSLLLVAGSETAEVALVNFLHVLLSHPAELEMIRKDPTLLNSAFTEFMRRDGVIVYEDRGIAEDYDLNGHVLKKGDIVRVALLSANNDESVFKDPRKFDLFRSDLHLDRERRSGGVTEERAGHLGFGLGRHFCIGYMLARAEIVTITELLLNTFENMSISKKNVDNIEMDWWVWSAKELIVDV